MSLLTISANIRHWAVAGTGKSGPVPASPVIMTRTLPVNARPKSAHALTGIPCAPARYQAMPMLALPLFPTGEFCG